MSKIEINISHNKKLNKCVGIKRENEIKFKSGTDSFVININENEILLEKTNDNGIISMQFNNTKITNSIYNIKGLGEINLNIKTNILKINNNSIYIEYEIMESNELHVYELKYEVK